MRALAVATLVACGAPIASTPAPVPGPGPTPTPTPTEAPTEAPRDRLGDPLPEGVVARLGTTRWRTSYAIYGVDYAADGETVLAASEGLQLFARESGRRLEQIDVEAPWGSPGVGAARAAATAVATLGPGRVVLVGAGRIEVLDLVRRVVVAATEAASEGGDPIAVSADGTLIGFRRDRRTAVVWSPGAGTITELGDHLSLTAVTLSADGRVAYTADGAMLSRWDLRAGRVARVRARDTVYDLDQAGGTVVAAVGDRVVVLDPRTMAELGGCHVAETVWAIDVDPIGLVAVATESQAAVCDPTSGKLQRVGTRRSTPHAIRWAPDGRELAVADEDVVELYATTQGDQGVLDLGGHGAELVAAAVTPSGRVVTADAVGEIRLWSALGAPLAELRRADGARIAGLGAVGEAVVVAERDGEVWRMELDGERPVRWRVRPGGRMPEGVAIRADGSAVAVAVGQRKSADEDQGSLHGVTVLDPSTGAQLHRYTTPARVLGVGWSAPGLWARLDGDRFAWLGATLPAAALPTGALPPGTSAGAAADSGAMFACGVDGRCTWRDAAGQETAGRPLSDRAADVALSPDGQLWAAGSHDGGLAIGRAGSADAIATRKHGDRSVRVAWAPDGRTLVSVSDDTTALVWSVAQLLPR